MPNQYRMSYFMPPIAPVRNEQGRMVTPPTLLPFCEVSVEQVFQMITCNENLKLLTAQVRNAPDMRTAKATLLPYVTPCGTFTRRNSKCFVSPSGLVVIDVDNLDSYDEAVSMRRLLFDDPFLCLSLIPLPRAHVCQSERPGSEGFRPFRNAVSRRRSTKYHGKYEQSHAVCRNGIRPGT